MAFIKKTSRVQRIPAEFEDLRTPKDLIEMAKSRGLEIEPLDIAGLTIALGIKTRYEPMPDDDSGSLVKDKKTGDWIMTVNSLHHPHRQRFTIAHEIGHRIKHSALSDDFKDKTFFRNGESNRIEAEANKFAAELLMPEELFVDFVGRVSGKVEDIASHFQVSSMAVRVRAKSLGYDGHNL